MRTVGSSANFKGVNMRKRISIAILAVLIAFTAILASTPTTGSCPTVNANNTTLARILIDRAEGGCVDNRVRFLGQGQWEISKYEVSMPSSVLVSGAGASGSNGTYTYRGTYAGKPYYNLAGQPDDIANYAVYWSGVDWTVVGGGSEAGMFLYTAIEDVAYPWLVVAWVDNEGFPPVPTVTEIPEPTFPPNIFANQAVNRASTY